MVGREKTLQSCLYPILEAYEQILFHGKKDLADMIHSRWRILWWGDDPDRSDGLSVRMGDRGVRVRKDLLMEVEGRGLWGHYARGTGSL